MRPRLRDLVPVVLVLAAAVACIGYLVGGGVQPLRSPWVLTAGLADWMLFVWLVWLVWLVRVVGLGRPLQARAPTNWD